MNMRLLEKFNELATARPELPSEKVLTHKLSEEFTRLAAYKSTRELEHSSLYQALQNELTALVFGYEYGCYADQTRLTQKPFLRAICWHLENGQNFKGILETLRNRALVSQADIYFFPATDIGMARSGNRNVIRDLAIELGYNYFFATSFLHLTAEPSDDGAQHTNRLGLEGNAIMTRLPLSNLRIIPLTNFQDPMKEDRKRIGCQKALLADLIAANGKKITVVCVNLPNHSSSRQRAKHIKFILNRLKKEELSHPTLLGGDLKTSTYNCKSSGHFLFSILNKMYRGFDYIIQEHHTYPEKHFDKRLFDTLKSYGFDYADLNELGKGCFHSKPYDLIDRKNPSLKTRQIIQKLLKLYKEKIPYKYDWFAANSLVDVSLSHQAERAKVISHLYYDGRPVSSHDPILLDFEIKTDS